MVKHKIEMSDTNEASPRENLSLLHMKNKGEYQLAHPRSLISAFVIHLLVCIISKRSIF